MFQVHRNYSLEYTDLRFKYTETNCEYTETGSQVHKHEFGGVHRFEFRVHKNSVEYHNRFTVNTIATVPRLL